MRDEIDDYIAMKEEEDAYNCYPQECTVCTATVTCTFLKKYPIRQNKENDPKDKVD